MYMKNNPFAVMPYRRQPNRRPRMQQPMNNLMNGMVTLSQVAVLGGVTTSILGGLQK